MFDATAVLIEWLASRLKVPQDALKMFKAAVRFSGLNGQTIPSELIPLNARQLGRGLLNFTVLQTLQGWVLPYWAERQYDPADPSFVPRSHLGLSINITHRNWTGAGNPDCPVEPIVDPRGLVSPFPERWSVDAWVKSGMSIIYPSKAARAGQRLLDHMPLVETTVEEEGLRLSTTCYTDGAVLVQEATVRNDGPEQRMVRLCFAVRPFNPEGVSLIHDLKFLEAEQSWVINGTDKVIFSEKPDAVQCSSYEEGDTAAQFARGDRPEARPVVHCPAGLASGITVYDIELAAGAEQAGEHFGGLAQLYVIAGNEEVLVDDADLEVAVVHLLDAHLPAFMHFAVAGDDADAAPAASRRAAWNRPALSHQLGKRRYCVIRRRSSMS